MEQVQQAEEIFYIDSNDGFLLALDNNRIINNDGEHGYEIVSVN